MSPSQRYMRFDSNADDRGHFRSMDNLGRMGVLCSRGHKKNQNGER